MEDMTEQQAHKASLMLSQDYLTKEALIDRIVELTAQNNTLLHVCKGWRAIVEAQDSLSVGVGN